MSIRSRRQSKSIAANNQIMNNQMFDLSSKLNDLMKSWKPDNTAAERVKQSINDDRTRFNKFTEEDKLAGERINDFEHTLNGLNNMSFNGAFSTARNLGLSEFTWKGKNYTTETKEEQNRRLGINNNNNNSNTNIQQSSGRTPTTYNELDKLAHLNNVKNITNTMFNNVLNLNKVSPTEQQQRQALDVLENGSNLITLILNDIPSNPRKITLVDERSNPELGYNGLIKLLNMSRPSDNNTQHGYETFNSRQKYVSVVPNVHGYGYLLVRKGSKPNWRGKYKDEDIIATTKEHRANTGGWSRYVPSKRSGGKFPVFRNGGIIGLI